jgi:hemoglobin/transferrin/lactoferrin receptor protein
MFRSAVASFVCCAGMLAAATTVFTEPRGPQPDDGSTLTVCVRAASTAAAVASARVAIDDGRSPVQTDQDGHAVITGLRRGPVGVRITADGFHPVDTVLTMGASGVRLDVTLNPAVIRVDESLIVAASRSERVQVMVPRSTTVIGRTVLDDRMARTTPEILQDQSGGWVQRTNHGGGSPFLRGLVGNQILVLIDGVRLNNSTFRLGPNQYMNSIDAYGLDRVEILRGSGSVAYGSDAVGGVVNLVTPKPALSASGLATGGAVSTRFASRGMEASGRAEGYVAGPRAAVRAGVTHRAFGDLVAGGSLGKEAPSAYDETDVDASGVWALSPRTRLTAVFQNVHQSDVPRYDQVAQRGYAVYSFDPQVRRLGYLDIEQRVGRRWLETVRLTASWHRSEEGRVRRKQGSVVETREADVISTAGLSTDLRGRPATWLSWSGGFDLYDDVVRSWRRTDNVSTRESVAAVRGLYPDGATRRSLAAFVMGSMTFGRAVIDVGTRYTRDDVRADDPTFGPVSMTPDAVVSSAALAYRLADGVYAFGSVAQAFRAPNIDDLSNFGVFDYGIEVPPAQLRPERSVAFEGGVKIARGRVSGSVAAFQTNLDGLIDREPTTYNGASMLDGQRVYRRANLGEAYIRGVEADAEWRVASTVTAFGFVASTYGRQRAEDVPLRRIPPAHGLLGVRQRWARGAWVEMAVRMARTQDRLAPGDLADYRIPAGGTPGWVTARVSAGVPLGRRLSLAGGLANAFDEAYRIHGSGVDGAGRHLWLTARVAF